MTGGLSASVISFSGRCGDAKFEALEVKISGLQTAYMMTLALPRSSCVGLAGKVDTSELYRALASAINGSGVEIAVSS